MFRGEKTYDTVLSPICNIKSVLKPNSCGKIYVLNSLLNSTHLIPVVVLVSYVTVSQSEIIINNYLLLIIIYYFI